MKKTELKRIEEWCNGITESMYNAKKEIPKDLLLLHGADYTFNITIALDSGIELVSEALKIPVHIETPPALEKYFEKVVEHHGVRFTQLMPYSRVMHR